MDIDAPLSFNRELYNSESLIFCANDVEVVHGISEFSQSHRSFNLRHPRDTGGF